MKTLVIIPSLMHKYSFSAPLAWLFSNNIEDVVGIYSYKLNKSIVKRYSSFIIELNWFIELAEFELIAKFIKKHSPESKILFGGLYSQLKYKIIFEKYPVDYFIKGDSELPIQLYLNGKDPMSIPNMVGRDFENDQTYIFKQEELKNLKYNMDWLSDYQLIETTAAPDDNCELDFSMMPLYPRYWDKPNHIVPESRKWRVPTKGGRYHLPMIITVRGGCQAIHDGCEYCMASKSDVLYSIYHRPPLVMDNETLIAHLKDIASKYKNACIYINSVNEYDLRGHYFDLDVTIEIDTVFTASKLDKILKSFRKAVVHMAIYNEGLTGKNVRVNLDELRQLEDENHKIYFFAFDSDVDKIPSNRRLYAEIVLPYWTNWEFYNDFSNAMKKSRDWYFITGQVNLFPVPRQIIMKTVAFIIKRILFILNRLNIVDLKKKIV
jgi:hypothetical protein